MDDALAWRRRALYPQDDVGVQSCSSSPQDINRNVYTVLQELRVQKALEVGKPLRLTELVEDVEAGRACPLAHDETEQRIVSRRSTLGSEAVDARGTPGSDVVDDDVGDGSFKSADVGDRVLVFSWL